MMRRTAVAGSSLLEVMVALFLLAVAVLGAIALQLATVRSEREAASREQALLIAASRAELERVGAAASIDWNEAAAALRQGRFTVMNGAEGTRVALVQWAVGSTGGRPVVPPCAGMAVVPGAACFSLAFSARWE